MNLELTHFKFECRLLSVLLAGIMAFNMVDPGLLILSEHRSVIATVARLCVNPAALAYTWFALAVLVTPFILMTLIAPDMKEKATVIKLACAAVCGSGVLWIYLAFLSRNLDYGIATGIFMRYGVASIGLGAVFAYSINSRQILAEQVGVA